MEVFAGKIEDPATLGSARGKHVGVVSAVEESGYKCDVIVSEWMGYALTYESMLASVIRARDAYLNDGGVMLPDLAEIWVAGCTSQCFSSGGYKSNKALVDDLQFWDDIEGFRMTSAARHITHQDANGIHSSSSESGSSLITAQVRPVPSESITTTASRVKELDMMTISVQESLQFEGTFKVQLTQPNGEDADAEAQSSSGDHVHLHALCIWFDALFSARVCPDHPVTLSTSPLSEQTHWVQTLLPLPKPVALSPDADVALMGRVSFDQHDEDFRGLRIKLEYGTFPAKSPDQSLTFPHIAHFEMV